VINELVRVRKEEVLTQIGVQSRNLAEFGFWTLSTVPSSKLQRGVRGSLVVKALYYKPEGRGFYT
jgi:hypothetical protein